jgi:hypothetical protein
MFSNIFIAKPAEANSLLERYIAVYMTLVVLYSYKSNGPMSVQKVPIHRMYNVCSHMSSKCISGLPFLVMVCI